MSAILSADPNFRSNSNEKHYDNETKADSSFEDNDSNSSQKSKEHAMNGEYLTLHKYHLVVVNDRILFRFACRKQREKYCCIIGTFTPIPICGLDGVLGMVNPKILNRKVLQRFSNIFENVPSSLKIWPTVSYQGMSCLHTRCLSWNSPLGFLKRSKPIVKLQWHVIRQWNGNFMGFSEIFSKIVKNYSMKRNLHFSGEWQNQQKS